MTRFSKILHKRHPEVGTNPSLLEAMACSALICANDNEFNRAILGGDALYFENSEDVVRALDETVRESHTQWLANNLTKIGTTYSWPQIVNQCIDHFRSIAQAPNS